MHAMYTHTYKPTHSIDEHTKPFLTAYTISIFTPLNIGGRIKLTKPNALTSVGLKRNYILSKLPEHQRDFSWEDVIEKIRSIMNIKQCCLLVSEVVEGVEAN